MDIDPPRRIHASIHPSIQATIFPSTKEDPRFHPSIYPSNRVSIHQGGSTLPPIHLSKQPCFHPPRTHTSTHPSIQTTVFPFTKEDPHFHPSIYPNNRVSIHQGGSTLPPIHLSKQPCFHPPRRIHTSTHPSIQTTVFPSTKEDPHFHPSI